LKDYIKSLIEKRRQDMKKPEFINRGDFLTILLEDEMFKNDEEVIIDECITFMIASSQTTSLLISNALFYLTQKEDIRQKIMKEIHDVLFKNYTGKMSEFNWVEEL
jgi:cytochrome P450